MKVLIIFLLLNLCTAQASGISVFGLGDRLNNIDAASQGLGKSNFFTGNFDFSDDKQASGLIGFQHQNDDLFRESFLGKLSPITGGFITENSAFYLYTGVQAEYEIGFLNTS